MGTKFRLEGFFMGDLTTFGVELSRKVDCGHAPFLLIFPECCESIRVACKELQNWIEADAVYDLFVRNDIRDYGKAVNEGAFTLRELGQKYHQHGFRVKQVS